MFKGLIGLVGVGVLGSVLSCSPRFERDFGVNASSNTTDFIYEEGNEDNRLREEGEKRKRLDDEFKKLDILIGNYLPVLGERSLKLVGLQGGYCVTKPENRFEFDEAEKGAEFVAYYFNGVNCLVPEKSFIEDELGDDVCKGLLLMLRNNFDFNLENSSIYTGVLIKDRKVEFDVDVCLDLCQEGVDEGEKSVIYFNRTCFSEKSDLNGILEIAKYIADFQRVRFSEFPVNINGLEKLAKEKGVRISVGDINHLNLTSLVEINGNYSGFRFLIRYLDDEGKEKLKEDVRESWKKKKGYDYKKDLEQRKVFGV